MVTTMTSLKKQKPMEKFHSLDIHKSLATVAYGFSHQIIQNFIYNWKQILKTNNLYIYDTNSKISVSKWKGLWNHLIPVYIT